MKILHTADWHIGKRLHKQELTADFQYFIEWLVELVEHQKVDVLLVSGDVFDLANPSSEARAAYYRALLKLKAANCKLIITGGNHDSPSVLNAPREILQSLDIHVIGGLPENLEDLLIPIKDKRGETQLVVAALPYLRDPELRSVNEEIGYESRVEAIREGIARIFKNVAAISKRQYPEIPALAMGHLYAAGASTSESERDIQIGNEAAFDASRFDGYFRYVALGHIHKPQQVNGPMPVLYSGSPLPLSFSEREDRKRVLLIDTGQGFEPQSIPVPEFRKLKRISGALSELRRKLELLEPGEYLPTLVELELIEEKFDPASLGELDRLVQDFDREGVEIVKHRATFKKQVTGADQLYAAPRQLEDLRPEDVFARLLEHHELDAEATDLLRNAFHQVLEEVQNREGA